MVKRIKLSVSHDKSSFEMIGMSCPLRDYRVIFLVNRILQRRFRKLNDLTARPWKSNALCSYPLYFDHDEDRLLDYFFIANHHPESKLIQELRQADYFMLISGEIRKEEVANSVRELIKYPEILAAFNVDIVKIKAFDYLITDLELHMLEVS